MKKILKLNKTFLFVIFALILFLITIILSYSITYINNKPKPFDIKESTYQNMTFVNEKNGENYEFTNNDFKVRINISYTNFTADEEQKIEIILIIDKLNESMELSDDLKVNYEASIFWNNEYKDQSSEITYYESYLDEEDDEDKERTTTISLSHTYPYKPIFGVNIKKPNLYIKITYTVMNNNKESTHNLYLKIDNN